MRICVQYSAQLRAAVGRPHDEFELPIGSSLATLLDRLVSQLDEAAREYRHVVRVASRAGAASLPRRHSAWHRDLLELARTRAGAA